MTKSQEVESLLSNLRTCPNADISRYFPPITDKIRFLSRQEKLECAGSLLSWAEKHAAQEPLKLHYAQFLMAMVRFTFEEHDEALALLSQCKAGFEELADTDGLGLSAMLIGATYRTLGNFTLALKILWESYELLKHSGKYPVSLAATANSIANISLDMHDYDDAVSMFQEALSESEKAGDHYFTIYALLGSGKVCMEQQRNTEAKVYFEKALQLSQDNNSPMHLANSLTELGNLHCQTGDHSLAEQLNEQALAIREEHQFTGGAITNYIHLGEIRMFHEDWSGALAVLGKGLALAEKAGVKLKMYQIHRLMSETHQHLQGHEKSLHHYKIFHQLREEVEQEDFARKLSDTKMVFEAEQTKKENAIIRKQKEEIQQKNLELQSTIDELTITRVSRKAKALTLVIAIVLFVLQDFILGFVLRNLPKNNYFLSLVVKMAIIFSLSPINQGIEHYLLKKVIRTRKNIVLAAPSKVLDIST